MKPLISENINSKLDEIVTKCFEGNRLSDRGMSILAVKFAMNKSEAILHQKVAHLFPALADQVSGYQGSRNNLTFYGITPADNTDYSNPLEFFDKLYYYMLDLETLVCETIDSIDKEDYFTKAFLLEFTRTISKVTEQCQLLLDKATLFNGDWMAFDHRIEDFIIL